MIRKCLDITFIGFVTELLVTMVSSVHCSCYSFQGSILNVETVKTTCPWCQAAVQLTVRRRDVRRAGRARESRERDRLGSRPDTVSSRQSSVRGGGDTTRWFDHSEGWLAQWQGPLCCQDPERRMGRPFSTIEHSLCNAAAEASSQYDTSVMAAWRVWWLVRGAGSVVISPVNCGPPRTIMDLWAAAVPLHSGAPPLQWSLQHY